MKTIQTRKHTIVYYDDIKEAPIIQYNNFQKYFTQVIGIGSDMKSVGNHFQNVFTLLGNEKYSDAGKELENLWYNYYFILEQINVSSIVFACMVMRIDDWQFQTHSEDEIKHAAELINKSGIRQAEVEQLRDDLKKNLTIN